MRESTARTIEIGRHNNIHTITFDDDAVLDPRPRSDNTRRRDRIRICRKGSPREALDRG